MKELNNRIYDKDVLEMITVAAELCVRLENAVQEETLSFCGDMLKILPLLYVKALMVNETGVAEMFGEAEKLVTEEDYDYVRSSVAAAMGAYDDYLDVFVEDMKYSDRPVRKTVSEDLADIYQDLRNLAGIYKQGFPEAMEAALSETMEGFAHYWGQRLVNVVRAIHDVKFSQQEAQKG